MQEVNAQAIDRGRELRSAVEPLLRRSPVVVLHPAGTRVTVVGFQAKDGSLRASSRDLQFPDGRRMDLGGSGSATQK